MPYTGPHVTASGGLISQDAASTVSNNIANALHRYSEEKKKRERNDIGLSYAAQEKDASGNSYIPTEVLAKWNSLSPTAQEAALGEATARWASDHHQQQAIDLIKARQQADSGDNTPAQVDPYVDPVTHQPVSGMGIVRKTGQVQRTSGGDAPDIDQYGHYWNGQRWVQQKKDKVDPQTAQATMDRQSQIAGLSQQIAENQNALDRGDDHVGGVFGIGSTPRAQVIAGLKAKRDALLPSGTDATGTATTTTAAAPPQQTTAVPARAATAQDQQALQWAQANPDDPRAAAILKKLGYAQ